MGAERKRGRKWDYHKIIDSKKVQRDDQIDEREREQWQKEVGRRRTKNESSPIAAFDSKLLGVLC